jgi:hypothetical protein
MAANAPPPSRSARNAIRIHASTVTTQVKDTSSENGGRYPGADGNFIVGNSIGTAANGLVSDPNGEERSIDIGAALKPGDVNRVKLVAIGTRELGTSQRKRERRASGA